MCSRRTNEEEKKKKNKRGEIFSYNNHPIKSRKGKILDPVMMIPPPSPKTLFEYVMNVTSKKLFFVTTPTRRVSFAAAVVMENLKFHFIV